VFGIQIFASPWLQIAQAVHQVITLMDALSDLATVVRIVFRFVGLMN